MKIELPTRVVAGAAGPEPNASAGVDHARLHAIREENKRAARELGDRAREIADSLRTTIESISDEKLKASARR